MTIVFPHIPKCAGTSLRQQFEASPLSVFLDYDHPPHHSKYYREACARRNREFEPLDFRRHDLIYGHFPIERYCGDQYRYVALLRHPVERAISHFFYWKNSLPLTNLTALHRDPIIREIKTGDVGLLEFAERQKLSMYYRNYLGAMSPSDFVLVGFTDRLEPFCRELSRLLNHRIDASIVTRAGTKEPVTGEELRALADMLSEELRWFERFYEYWRARGDRDAQPPSPRDPSRGGDRGPGAGHRRSSTRRAWGAEKPRRG